MKDIAIKVEQLNKTFSLHSDVKRTARQLVSSLFRQGKVKHLHVLQDINLEIRKGEFLGIVGRNGSGKSTLLKVLAGIYEGDKGTKLSVKGKIVPFLELGVGFNEELTGRENIYLNGTILGMTKKYLDEKFDEIVAFTELEEFINEPVKNYSSGMLVRLAFGIAIQADADIYILDEILAVGDEAFQRKCISIMNNLKKSGKTILFVSHSMDAIQSYCTRAILISDSKLVAEGKPGDVINKYRQITDQREEDKKETEEKIIVEQNRVGDRSAEIYKVEIVNEKNEPVELITTHGDITVRMHYRMNNHIYETLLFGVSIFRDDDLYVSGTNTKNYSLPLTAKAEGVVEYTISTRYLIDGKYLFTVAVFDYETVQFLDFHSKMYPFEVRLYNPDLGAASIPVEWKFK